MTTAGLYKLTLLGPFGLYSPSGMRIEISSKKGMALIALLAMASEGERSRVWLQSKLWGSRATEQAQSSLRRELSNLRAAFGDTDAALIDGTYSRVRLALDLIAVDARELEAHLAARTGKAMVAFGEFLEGLDIAGEEGFEDWLRVQRTLIHELSTQAKREALDLDAPQRLAASLPKDSAPHGAPRFVDRPAIAVLPMENMTGDPALDYLTDGISEDLVDRLSCLRWLPVISRSSSFAFRGTKDSPNAIGRHLGARYIIEGRLRLADGGFTLMTSMADVETGFVLWSQRHQLPEQFSQKFLIELVGNIVAALDMKIDQEEKTRASGLPETDLGVNQLIWRGRWHLHKFTRKDGVEAERLFDEALAIEPHSAEAKIQQAFAHARSIWAERESVAKMRELRRLTQRAIVADHEDGRSYMYAGMAEMWLRNAKRAGALFDQSVSLSPSLALAHAQRGSLFILTDQAEQALEPLNLALRLGPSDEHTFYVLGELALANFMIGEWQRSIELADQSLSIKASYWHAHCTKINALVLSEAFNDAAEALRELYLAKPDFDESFVDWIPFTAQFWPEVLKQGIALTQASLQSQPPLCSVNGL